LGGALAPETGHDGIPVTRLRDTALADLPTLVEKMRTARSVAFAT